MTLSNSTYSANLSTPVLDICVINATNGMCSSNFDGSKSELEVELSFHFNTELGNGEYDEVHHCVWRNVKQNLWDTAGCTEAKRTSDELVCHCSHLTEFGVMTNRNTNGERAMKNSPTESSVFTNIIALVAVTVAVFVLSIIRTAKSSGIKSIELLSVYFIPCALVALSAHYDFGIDINYSSSIVVELSAVHTILVCIVHICRVLRADLNIISRNLVHYGIVGTGSTLCLAASIFVYELDNRLFPSTQTLCCSFIRIVILLIQWRYRFNDQSFIDHLSPGLMGNQLILNWLRKVLKHYLRYLLALELVPLSVVVLNVAEHEGRIHTSAVKTLLFLLRIPFQTTMILYLSHKLKKEIVKIGPGAVEKECGVFAEYI